MKKVLYGAYLWVALCVIIIAIVKMWHICLPLSIVMICTQVAGIFKAIARKVSGEEEVTNQELARSFAYLPVEVCIVYNLWSSSLVLAIAYGIVVAITLFIQFLLTKDEEMFS